ncbi:MAG: colanic acid biosynthesis acetyltransferase WcaF [Bacteroidia bacterium]|nr:colanic acid biosynthesis acetyltransferase WcaF [Bacteroidia bacterium]
MNTTQLNTFSNKWYKPSSKLKIALWYVVNQLCFNNSFALLNFIKAPLLRAFGAQVGVGVTIKPAVNIKYPWLLSIGNYCWIGENVWIDNLAQVTLHNNVCVSQGALLLCGNHNYKKTTFDLIVQPITLHDGVWIGAKCNVTGGVVAHSHAMLTVASVASTKLDSYSIYRGNPAIKIKNRVIS